jgi:cell wall-associated NlpC family hydrolase
MIWITKHRKSLLNTAFLLTLAGLAGCASTPPVTQNSIPDVPVNASTAANSQTSPQRALATAVDMLGTPYRYGGASPRGFDCSGLVYYAYRKAGIQTPRTTKEQYHHTKRIQVSHLQPGDLIFFSISRDRLSHVGIYAGDGRFIHAPSSGKSVAYASLDNPYWRARLTGVGRLQ